MSDLSLCVTSEPDAVDIETISGNLAAFNAANSAASEHKPLAVIVRDGNGARVAGMSGYTAWGWLYVQRLWVAESQRGRNLAGRMLAAAEKEALSRGCHGAWIDTFSPIALRVYERAGYTAFGELKNFPKSRTRTFLQKSL